MPGGLLAAACVTLATAAWSAPAQQTEYTKAYTTYLAFGEALQQPDPLIEQRTKGDPSAPLTVYEVSDFQCPFCRVFAVDVLPQLEQEYISQGKLQIVFVNLPIVQLHPNAAAAHEFAMCAAQQDRFWPIHDLLYRTQAAWSHQDEPYGFFMTLADSAGLDRDSLTQCIDTGALRWLVEAEATAVASKGIRSTPSFIVEGLLLAGAQEMGVWRPLLDSLFAAKTGGS